jgi:prepilin-type processing-associated H-X9-DG protein
MRPASSRHSFPSRARAFTLVELLVVIGIIAALIGILLPVLSSVSARGRDLKCQANLRSIVQLLQTYAAESKGSLPFGVIWERFNPQTWDQLPGNNNAFVSWASIITKMSRGKGAQIEDGDVSSPYNGPFLKCPEAQLSYNQLVSYVVNMVAMTDPYACVTTLGGRVPPQMPAKLNGMFPHTALVWDTAVFPNSDESVGYLTSADVDDSQRLWQGVANIPQWCFFDPRDPYARLGPTFARFGNTKPVIFKGGTSGDAWRNIDPAIDPNTGSGYPYQGNLRFRHNKNTSCNVAFADGHVESFKAKFNPDNTMRAHDVLRKYFLLKWPAGVPRNDTVP